MSWSPAFAAKYALMPKPRRAVDGLAGRGRQQLRLRRPSRPALRGPRSVPAYRPPTEDGRPLPAAATGAARGQQRVQHRASPPPVGGRGAYNALGCERPLAKTVGLFSRTAGLADPFCPIDPSYWALFRQQLRSVVLLLSSQS